MYKSVYERNDNSNSSRLKIEDPSNSVLKLSGSKILCNSYRNKKNLNTPLKAIENIKMTPNIHNNQLLTISNENLPSYKKIPLQIRNNNNLESENYYNFGKNILLKAINNNNLNLNKNNSSKLYTKTDNNSSSLDIKKINNNNKEKFVFLHEIKKIKKKVDLSHKNKSIKNIMDNQIPYDEKNSYVAMKPIKILNNFQDYKENEVLNKNNNNLFSFLTEKTKISRKNVLIKLLLDQKDNYDKTISSHQKMLTEIKKNIDTAQNNFETLVKSQKQSSKIIEDLLEKLLLRKRNLLIEHFNLQFDLRTRKDERQKMLEHINDYRIIAKFVTKALGGSGRLFEFRLTTYGNDNNFLDNDIISEKETQRVLFRFNFLLNPNPKSSHVNQDDIDIFNEITSLNHSDLLVHQLWKKEDSVLNILKKNENIEKEKIIFEESEEKKIEYLKDKIEILEKELKYNKEIFEAANKEYESLYKKISLNNSDFEGIITDLYNFVFEDKIKKIKKKYYIKDDDFIDVHDYIRELQKEMIKKERMMNNLKFELDKSEKEDKLLFDRVVNNVKSENKMIHVHNIKKIQEFGDLNKLKLLKIPKEKIILKYRRSEPPYYKAKKEKQIKVEPELIKQSENEELLTYD